MCRLFLANREGLDRLGPNGTQQVFEILEMSFGGHGNGVAYIKKGRVYIKKGVRFSVSKATKLAFENGVEWFIFHTRWASVGDISSQNCHPFQYGHIVAAMNGTESGLKDISKAMGGITDTEASVISIAATSEQLPAIEIAKRFNELDSVFVGLIKEKQGYVPFASVGSARGDLQVYQDGEAIIIASELPLKDETQIMDALDGFYWAGGPIPERRMVSANVKNQRKRGLGFEGPFDDFPEEYRYYGYKGLR